MQRLVAGEVDEAEIARVMEEDAGLRRRRSNSPVRPGERQSSYLNWLAEEQEASRISEEEIRRMGEIHRNWSELVHGEETREGEFQGLREMESGFSCGGRWPRSHLFALEAQLPFR